MERITKRLKFTSLLGIIACVIMYLLAFSPFDKDAVVSEYDDYEFYTQCLMTGMCIVGIIMTSYMVGYISVQSGKSKSEATTNICTGIVNIIASLVGIYIGNRLIDATVFHHETEFVEPISNFYARSYLVMVYVLLGVAILHTINAVIGKVKERDILSQQVFTVQAQTNIKEKIAIVPVVVGAVPVMCTFVGVISRYMLASCVTLIPYTVAFALPVCVWFIKVVAKWERDRRYRNVAISYLVYMLVTYGAMHCLFSTVINWLGMYTVLSEIISPLLLSSICIGAGLVGLVLTLVKSVHASAKVVTE